MKKVELAAVCADLRLVRDREFARDDPAPFVAVLARQKALSRFVTPDGEGGYHYDHDWREVFEWLAAFGGIDLSTARLFEGHLNALQLVALYGTPEQQTRVLDVLGEGGVIGVWGAEVLISTES